MLIDSLAGFFSSDSFMPHGMCYLWDPLVLWLHAGSDLLIGAAYFSIPVVLALFTIKRRDLQYRWVAGLFMLFIVACGTTHLFGVWTIWNPDYAIEGLLKAITALVSLATAIVLWPLLPKLLALPSPSMLAQSNAELQAEIDRRRAAETRLQNLNAELERRVAERTAELENKNTAFEAEIAQRQEVERQLVAERDRAEVANQTKSQFLALMSHELRTPLNAIMGFSEMIKTEAFGPLGQARYREYAHDIHASGEHLLQLITEILDLSKIEAGKMELREEQVVLNEVSQETQRLFHDKAAEHTLTFATETTEAVTITADRLALKQMLINLISNALKFTPLGGRIDVSTDVADDGNLEIAVTDTGPGMDQTELEQAVRAFGQTSAGRKAGGTGLGLTLTAALAHLHGGRLDIDSEPGHGTTITIVLPGARIHNSVTDTATA
ncbi:sensor histidine kinase [Rhodovibrio salinarum]|uniref:histidine kinase n=1 Tax=Rhodovibrio salinarum TaxID=1087 RepID=A0A934QN06_9PROT|nr:HAMP domain-containing sensor histidine kinase [Rhodovibrio salinarum]MBK1699195.1 sensor histidine kinase [Rhodovibrio salinarum]